MSADERIHAFLQLAEEEIAAAKSLSATNRRQAAYFCQQAAEKMARAILTDAVVLFGTGHNLGQMAAALPADHPFRVKLTALDKHSPAATRYRYPGPTGKLAEPPRLAQLQADIRELDDLLTDVRAYLKK